MTIKDVSNDETSQDIQHDVISNTDSKDANGNDRDNVSEPFVEMMSFPEQEKFVDDCINDTLRVDDTWYILSVKWYDQWKRYIRCSIEQQDNDSEHPGPIDNSNLLCETPGKLKEHLLEGANYKVINSQGWDKLVEWFGLAEGQQAIARKVIESGKYNKETKVEVYLVELKLSTFKDLENVVVKEFSKLTTLESVVNTMKSIFDIPQEDKVRLWHTYGIKTYEQIVKLETTLQDFDVGSGQTLVLEQKNEKNEWPRATRSRSLSGSTSLTPTSSLSDSPFSSGSYSAYSSSRYSSYSSKQKLNKEGLCGLANLGNTCFMNSALQCLSNTTPLTKYFLSGTYKHELNPTNPLGMHGKIAEAYADLQNEMWSGHNDHIAPRHFKMMVGRFAPQFSGYQQQDSQELLAFLLDGLHEDLNRVKQKPYIELEDDNGRPDEVVAKEAWANHTKRNSSVITDNFHGLFKSTVVCPKCKKKSVTFDPFCYLSLPLPIKKERYLQVTFVPDVPTKKPIKLKVIVPINGKISDLTKAVSKITGSDPAKLIVADIFNSKFHKRFERKDNLSQIADKDDIYIYESPFALNDPQLVMIPVYLREIRKSNSSSYSYSSYSYNSLFGKPLMVPIPRDAITVSDLYQKILQWMRRYVTAPTIEDEIDEAMSTADDNDNQDISMSDNEDGDEERDDKNDTKQNDSEREDEEEEEEEEKTTDQPKLSVPTRLFEIKITNSSGNNDIKDFSYDDPEGLKLSPRVYLAIDWYPKLKKVYYDEDLAKDCEDHPSLYEFPAKKTVDLDDCLKLFLTEEELGEEDPWYCPVCKEHRQAYKKFDLWSLPKVLVIHLKRFSYSRAWRDKLDTLVNFPLRELDLTNYVIDKTHGKAVYDLHAVSNHYGGLGGGHYTAYAVNWYDSQWYYFDDSSVSSADSSSPVSKAAYVLFYTRRDDPNIDIWSTTEVSTGMDL